MATTVRPADARDLPSLARFALALALQHVAIDARRFVAPERGLDTYLEFFAAELERPEVALLIAQEHATAVGYAFVRMEPASLEALSVPMAWLHDVFVDPAHRGRGVGRLLVLASIEAARRLGSSSLMLGVSPANADARRLYERLGMRVTMTEMRLDLE